MIKVIEIIVLVFLTKFTTLESLFEIMTLDGFLKILPMVPLFSRIFFIHPAIVSRRGNRNSCNPVFLVNTKMQNSFKARKLLVFYNLKNHRT